MKRKRRLSKIAFEGFNIVLLPDECSRETQRYWHGGGMIAVLQRNGNVGMSRTGLFDRHDSIKAQLRAAQCLRGLKLISAEMLARYQERHDAQEAKMDLAHLESDAEHLGYKLVKLPKAKTIKRTYRSRTKL